MSLRATRQPDMSMFFQFIDMKAATCSLRQHVTAAMSPKLHF
jgi:hypothetical protein